MPQKKQIKIKPIKKDKTSLLNELLINEKRYNVKRIGMFLKILNQLN